MGKSKTQKLLRSIYINEQISDSRTWKIPMITDQLFMPIQLHTYIHVNNNNNNERTVTASIDRTDRRTTRWENLQQLKICFHFSFILDPEVDDLHTVDSIHFTANKL